MTDKRVRDHPVLSLLGAAAATATIFGFILTVVGWPPDGAQPDGQIGDRDTPSMACEPHVSLSRGRGPSGSNTVVTGTGFPADSDVDLRFHTESLVPGHTDSEGSFRVRTQIPGTFDAFAGQQFMISAASGACADLVPFFLTAE